MRRFFHYFALFAALILVPLVAQAGEAATDFSLRDINNKPVSLAEFKGEVIVLSFWATWCGPCKVEMKHLNEMHKELAPKGFRLISISTDDARTASQVKPFIKKSRYDFTVLLDRESKVVGSYNPTKTLPYTVIIDREFNVHKVHSGYNPGDEVELRKEIEALLGPS